MLASEASVTASAGAPVDVGRNWPRPVTADLAYLRTAIVNVVFHGKAGSREWVLIDAGMPGHAGVIRRAAASRFGAGVPPVAILLTHGHFDHVGSLEELVREWDVPVYVHALERPHVTGGSPYPPPDPTVDDGLMARMSWLYPRGPIDLGGRVRLLPKDGTAPGMSGWQWIHTPGHTPGHVSFYHERSGTLVAGDAFVTTDQESLSAVLAQRPEVHRPPAYYTSDWSSARRSVERLASLRPETAITGHGPPMSGPGLRERLNALALDFEHRAKPRYGRYVNRPAVSDERGVVSIPPDPSNPWRPIAAAFGAGLGLGLAVVLIPRRDRV